MEKEICSWMRSEADGGRGILLVHEQNAVTQVPFDGKLKISWLSISNRECGQG